MRIKKILLLLLIGILTVVVYKFSVHPVVLRTLFPEKIWAHRVNSLGKLEETKDLFRGVEVDLVWEEGNFDVNHPPAKSIQLSLAEFLNQVTKTKGFGLWLDYKNLDSAGAENSAFHLDSLFKKRGLAKNMVYVESRNPAYLKHFNDRGFKTSYYLPAGLNQISDEDSINAMVRRINSRIHNDKEIFISAPFADYDFMREHFPERKILIWHLGGLYGPQRKLNIYRALLDENVEVVLRPYKGQTADR